MKEWAMFHLSKFLVDSAITIIGLVLTVIITIILACWINKR